MNWLTGLGSAAAGWFGYKGTKDQNIASAQQARQQMDFQERMSNTAIQRRMADLRKGGLNPILAGKHEASSPAGQQAPMHNKAAVALQHASTAAQIKKIMADTRLTEEKADVLRPLSLLQGNLGDVLDQSKDSFQQKFGINISEGEFGNLRSIIDFLVGEKKNNKSNNNGKNKGIESRIESRDPREPSHWGRSDSSKPWMPRYFNTIVKKIEENIPFTTKHRKYQYQKWRN